jgi:hypothetical protein
VFWIFTDGRNTERAYFQTLKQRLGVSVELPKDCGGKSPKEVVNKALAKRREERTDSDSSGDQFWVVFDDDARDDVAEARSRCANSVVKTAISNPCFEIWLLLHFTDYDRPDDQAEVQRELESWCPGYSRDRQKLPDVAALIENLAGAEQRAAALDNRREAQGNPNGRPSTQVYMLTRALRGAAG